MIARPTIIAPDTSHWANWIDAAIGDDQANRQAARSLHGRLLHQGRVPLISWHHLEELFVVDEPANASARLSFLQSLPLIAWMTTPCEPGLGGIVDILGAEAVAFDAGCQTLVEVRDHARSQLLRTGSGFDALGQEVRGWKVMRHVMMGRRLQLGMVSALSTMNTMDDLQTVGELSRQRIRPPAEMQQIMAAIHRNAFDRAKMSDPRRSDDEALTMADDFLCRVQVEMPTGDVPVRQLLVEICARQGIEEDEVHDDSTIAELSELGTFRSQLQVVAEMTGLSFEHLKRVRMDCLPSWRIAKALKCYGQDRRLKPGSDVHDQHLAVLAAYTDELYVDKRTHEDFRRVTHKEHELACLFGAIRKASLFGQLAEKT